MLSCLSNIFLQSSRPRNLKTTSLSLDFERINRDTKYESAYGTLMDVLIGICLGIGSSTMMGGFTSDCTLPLPIP